MAAASDGCLFCRPVRLKLATSRDRGKRPRSIRRRLAKDRAKESRYKKDLNHCESKKYVELAKGTGRGIAIEDLKGIRDRVTARGENARNRLSGWSFFQFRSFAGVQGVARWCSARCCRSGLHIADLCRVRVPGPEEPQDPGNVSVCLLWAYG